MVSSKTKINNVEISTKDKRYNPSYEYLGTRSLIFKSLTENSDKLYIIYHYIVVLFALLTRILYINKPAEVVFDEVHFGKFASYYLENEFFFDLHPPMGKICTYLLGKLVRYNGEFKFDDIAIPYPEGVPFLFYRLFNCFLGVGICSLVFKILKELKMKPITCLLGAMLVVFDNSHIIESRLILLDAQLNFWIVASIYAFVRFYKLQLNIQKNFTWSWYLWLNLTGLFLSFVISIKYVGVLTFLMIGVAVAFNLWQLLDKNAKISDKTLLKHLLLRVQALIICPFIYYLFWFYLHFQILYKSGQGDNFMSPEFQRNLEESPILKESRDLNYFDIVNFKSSDGDCMLYSNGNLKYPFQYPDGRISSQGQQVTCAPNDYHDDNSWWQILPTVEGVNSNHGVAFNAVVQLKHVKTNSVLKAHDVASPLHPTNEEITTIPAENITPEDYEFTLFKLDFVSGKAMDPKVPQMKTKYNKFRLIHVKTQVALLTDQDFVLPEWALHHYEVNGNKKIHETANQVWSMEKIKDLPAERDISSSSRYEKPKMSFFSKYAELQKKMFAANNGLPAEHPFASSPEEWPLSLSGVSYWNDDSTKRQIFFIGNLVGWWLQVAVVMIYVIIICLDLIIERRGFKFLTKDVKDQLYGTSLWLILGWLCHYLPFFLMNRQKFLHHYLPAHLILCVFTAHFIEIASFIKFAPNDQEEDENEKMQDEKTQKINNMKLHILVLFIIISLVLFLNYWRALTYGLETLTIEETKAREWFDIKLQYTK
ncbi:hypothetical protein ACO0SA_002207 [Hanseniaspora valbyensis]